VLNCGISVNPAHPERNSCMSVTFDVSNCGIVFNAVFLFVFCLSYPSLYFQSFIQNIRFIL